jgi:hypothetical protein
MAASNVHEHCTAKFARRRAIQLEKCRTQAIKLLICIKQRLDAGLVAKRQSERGSVNLGGAQECIKHRHTGTALLARGRGKLHQIQTCDCVCHGPPPKPLATSKMGRYIMITRPPTTRATQSSSKGSIKRVARSMKSVNAWACQSAMD